MPDTRFIQLRALVSQLDEAIEAIAPREVLIVRPAQLHAEAVAAGLRPGGLAAWAEHNSLGVTVAANLTSADANTHGSSHRAAVRVAARAPPGRAA